MNGLTIGGALISLVAGYFAFSYWTACIVAFRECFVGTPVFLLFSLIFTFLTFVGLAFFLSGLGVFGKMKGESNENN